MLKNYQTREYPWRRIKDKEVKRRSYKIYNVSASQGFFLHKEKVLIHIFSKNVNSDVDWQGRKAWKEFFVAWSGKKFFLEMGWKFNFFLFFLSWTFVTFIDVEHVFFLGSFAWFTKVYDNLINFSGL